MAHSSLLQSLGDRYRIERELGQGGMATVYLAEDVRHHRRVALKVLHPELSAVIGSERFLKEIELTANLQHPHILPLFDSGNAEGQLFYVMPFVEGETLRARLERERQLPIEDSLRIAREVADALQYAHERGVIHRDIKPENILLQGGHALVADFGIALAVQQAGGARMTQTGLSLGTPQYMAPEQAMGDRGIDARADVYALGAVTYEMLAGEPPFTGPTAQAIVAKVLTADPPSLATLRRNVAPHVAAAVHRALEKLPADRHARAGDFAADLAGATPTGATLARATVAHRVTAPRTKYLLVATTLIAAGTSALAAWALTRPAPQRPLMTFTIGLPDSLQVTEFTLNRRIGISRDGSHIAFIGGSTDERALYVRALDDTLPRLVRGAERGSDPVFSPDNQFLYFNRQGSVMRVPITGGTPSVVAESAMVGDVSARNEVLFRRGTGIWLLGETGQRLLALPDSTRGETAVSSPRFGEDGASVFASVVVDGRAATGGTAAHFRLSDGRRTDLGIEGRVIAQASGHLLIGRDGALWAVPWDRSKRVQGPPVEVLSQVASRNTAIDVGVSAEGSLAYLSGSIGALYRLVAVDLEGMEREVDNEAQRYSWPRVSPDGRRVAVEIGAPSGGYDVWLHDIGDRSLTRLTNNFTGVRPIGWSADGRRIAYLDVTGGGTAQMRRTVAWIPFDLSAPRELVPVQSEAGVEDATIGASREVLAVRIRGYTLPGDIMLAPLDSPRVARAFVATSADEETPRFSPDGQWLAYSSDETGRYEVYVRPVSAPGGRVQVSAGGGSEPVWARDGRSVFYRGQRHVVRAILANGPTFAVQQRDTLFVDDYRKEVKAVAYDVFPDGRSLLMQKRTSQSSRQPTLVFNWPELVRRRSGPGR